MVFFNMLLSTYYTDTVQWLQQHLLTCPSKKYLHIDCPGCGFQRSVIALLKGDIAESVQLYPAAIPVLTLIMFAILHLKFKFTYGAAVIKYLQIFSAAVILGFYIYKIINQKIIY